MKQITIRKYGARLVGKNDTAILHAMQAQNRLWNALVEIERGNTEQYRQIVRSSDAELDALTAQHEQAELTMQALIEQRNRTRAAKRTKAIEGAENYAAAIKAQSAQMKELRAQMKACRSRAKEAAKPKLEALEAQRREAVKQASKAANLWWAHAELVLGAFDVARARALKTNATLRFHRFEGEGRIGVRWQAGMLLSNPPATSLFKLREATPEELGHLKASRPGKTIKAVDIRIGKPDDNGHIPQATFLITIHEGMELCPDAPLKTVTVKREMHAGKPKWFMVFMFIDPDASEPEVDLPSEAIGIDLGWRQVIDADNPKSYALRVGYGSTSQGDGEQYALPSSLIERFDRADRIRSELDTAANDFWARLAPMLTDEALADQPEDSWLRVIVGKAKRAKRPYPSLMLAVCDALLKTPILDAVSTDWITGWQRSAKRMTVDAFGARRRAVDHRKHLYRNIAARLVRQHGMIAIKDTDFAELAKLVDSSGRENELHERARANRVIASPSELKAAIIQAAKREHRELRLIDPVDKTVTCSNCGHVNGGPIEDLNFVCSNCGTLHDQDANSSKIVLKSALESTS